MCFLDEWRFCFGEVRVFGYKLGRGGKICFRARTSFTLFNVPLKKCRIGVLQPVATLLIIC